MLPIIAIIAGAVALSAIAAAVFMSTRNRRGDDNRHSLKLNFFSQEKRKEREENRRAKKIRSTLEWMDINSISANGIVLKRGKSTRYVKGVVITPINITIRPEAEKVYLIKMLANALDRMRFQIYWKFVKTEPDIGFQLMNYTHALEKEENNNIAKLLELQIAKLGWFKDNYSEMSFFALVQADEKHIDKKFTQLCSGLGSVFQIRDMRCTDYENLVSQELENDTVNEYMFTQLLLPEAFSSHWENITDRESESSIDKTEPEDADKNREEQEETDEK